MARSSGRPYVFAWLALVLLTALSAAASGLSLGAWGIAMALVIAAGKAVIVGLVFMHLASEPFATRLVAALNVTWVLLICLGIAADVAVW